MAPSRTLSLLLLLPALVVLLVVIVTKELLFRFALRTAEDVKATFDRIHKPPQGVSIPRSVLFAAVGLEGEADGVSTDDVVSALLEVVPELELVDASTW